MMKEPQNTPIPSITLHCGAARFGAVCTITAILSQVFDRLPVVPSLSSASRTVAPFGAIMSSNVSVDPSLNPANVAA
jgi:hypothetical protein